MLVSVQLNTNHPSVFMVGSLEKSQNLFCLLGFPLVSDLTMATLPRIHGIKRKSRTTNIVIQNITRKYTLHNTMGAVSGF